MISTSKHDQGLELLKKVKHKTGSVENKDPFPHSEQELVDEISLDIEVMNIMDEVHLYPSKNN